MHHVVTVGLFQDIYSMMVSFGFLQHERVHAGKFGLWGDWGGVGSGQKLFRFGVVGRIDWQWLKEGDGGVNGTKGVGQCWAMWKEKRGAECVLKTVCLRK